MLNLDRLPQERVMIEGLADAKPVGRLQSILSKLRSLLPKGRGATRPEVDVPAVTPPEEAKEPEPFPGLDINIVFEPFIAIRELGKRGSPSSINVQTGTMVYATHNQEPFDHDGMPEVYLEGERVTKSRFRRKDRCIVAGLAEQPGRFWFRLTKWLPGISESENDLAIAQFLYFIRLVDPRKFLSSESRWPTPRGQDRLRRTIRDLIILDVQGTFQDQYIQVWSSPTIGDVADMIFSSLDRKLREWGLALMNNFVSQRCYPERLSQVVLQFKASERELLETREMRGNVILEWLGLGPADLMVLGNESEKYGAGAGLFIAAKRAKKPFIEWLRSEKASEAANFLEELYSGKFPLRDVELSENVVRSAFRHPVLGLGEWGDAELSLAETSAYRQFEDYLQGHPEGS